MWHVTRPTRSVLHTVHSAIQHNSDASLSCLNSKGGVLLVKVWKNFGSVIRTASPPDWATATVASMVGIVALGDSLLDTERSWAWWLSEAMALPLRNLARSGSQAPDVIAEQLPQLAGYSYELACLSLGTNDVIQGAWSTPHFEDDLSQILGALQDCATKVVTHTVSLDLNQLPGAGGPEMRFRVEQLNAILKATSSREVLIASGTGLRGWRYMWADKMHPTPLGQATLADRASELLELSTVPSTLHAAEQPSRGQHVRALAVQRVRHFAARPFVRG